MKNRLEETLIVTPNLTYDHPFWEFRSDWEPIGYTEFLGAGSEDVPHINALFIIQQINIADCREEVEARLLTKIEHNTQIEAQLVRLLGY